MAATVQPLSPPRRGEFRLETERIEKLAAKLENAGDPETRAAALDLVQSVIELHGAALDRMIESFLKRRRGSGLLARP